jgi:16S rRNA (guanine527-N7)-methyltransferase
MHSELPSPAICADWQPRFTAFYDQMMQANQRMNLTRVTDRVEFESKHLLDSVALLQALPDSPHARLIDVGTGGGVPGIPLWLMRPDWEVTLLDTVGKKIRACAEMTNALQQQFPEQLSVLPHCLQGRAEVLGHDPKHRAQYDIVVSRAVATLPVLLEYCLPLLKRGGLFVAMKGPSYHAEMDEINVVAGLLGGRLATIAHYTLPPDLQRVLLCFEKRSQTPHILPRKDSNLRKRPLNQAG